MNAAPLLLLLFVALLAVQVMGRRRRVESQRAMLAELVPGDEVVTSGGLIGTIVEVGDYETVMELAPGTVVRVAKAAVIGRPPVAAGSPPSAPDHSEDSD